ncbi:MAG: hypothetical protein IJY08_02445 [Clostridia bacterium]|nr:hypothetical protein [Clostridia bacterium]
MKTTRKTKILAIVIALMTVISMLPMGMMTVSAAPSGTAIYSEADFAGMSADGEYYLANNITLSATYTSEFTGTFDGNGMTVTTSVPMFDKVTNATIQNFTVELASGVEAISVTSGGAVACTATNATFKDITNNASVTASDYFAGGIVGTLGETDTATTVTFEGCVNNGDITGPSKGYAGGIVSGANFDKNGSKNVTVISRDCANTGDLNAKKSGGFSAYFQYCKNVSVYGFNNSGAVTGADLIGGILGQVHSSAETLYIYNCKNIGDVTCAGHAGGIIGYCQIAENTMATEAASKVIISGCYNGGNVDTSATSGKHVGGIIGRSYGGIFEYCGNDGTITDGDASAGIVGHSENINIIRYSYNAGNITANKYAAGIVGVSKNTGDKIYGCYNSGALTGGTNMSAQIAYIAIDPYGTVENNYYSSDVYDTGVYAYNIRQETFVNDNAVSFSSYQLAYGDLAYTLNTLAGRTVFYQNLVENTDAHPVLDATHGTVIQVSGGYTSITLTTDEKAAIRIADDTAGSGLRFVTSVNKAEYDALISAGVSASDITVGTVIAPKSYVDAVINAGGSFNMADLDAALTTSVKYLDVPVEVKGVDAFFESDSDSYSFRGSVIGINDYSMDFAAVGYIMIGSQIAYSAEYSVRNIADIASAAYYDRASSQMGDYVNEISSASDNAIGGVTYSPYTDEQLTLIKSFMN